MRAKRSKQYRKLMREYCRVWNFREPYQVLVDADIVKDASRFKMDLVPALERTLHGKVKPMITQCSMRHLYKVGSEPGMKAVIDYAKETFERRRCGHHPDETEALSTLECLSSFIVDSGKGARNRYVVASQDDSVRRHMRGVRGVPLIYISRSVMILEPMASGSADVVAREERAKFRSEIRSLAPAGSKRKRGGDGDEDDSADDDDDDGDGGDENGGDDNSDDGDGDRGLAAASRQAAAEGKKRKKNYGPKGPNPLAAKKKKRPAEKQSGQTPTKKPQVTEADAAASAAPEQPAKKKRKRKHKKPAGSGESQPEGASAGSAAPAPAPAAVEEA